MKRSYSSSDFSTFLLEVFMTVHIWTQTSARAKHGSNKRVSLSQERPYKALYLTALWVVHITPIIERLGKPINAVTSDLYLLYVLVPN